MSGERKALRGFENGFIIEKNDPFEEKGSSGARRRAVIF
jgi:hypothetical protein